MSLWYESLSLGLHDCGDNVVERARCILAYLSMPVPRSWWDHALRTGHVDDTHASVLHDLQMELSKVVDLGEPISYGLLVALAFTDEDPTESGLDGMNSQTTVNDYLIKAKKVLAERPELAQLGSLIDEEEKRHT
jgi:hypothetical protein